VGKVVEYKYKRGDLVFATKATKVEKDWYEWTVELEKAPVVLDRIKEVEYILHPTFKDRIRRVRTPGEGFKIDSEGWGEFDIAVNIYFRDGDEQTVVVPLKLE